MEASPSQEFDYLLKLLLIGDSGVGKSTLLLSFTSSTFEDLSPTTGVDFKIKHVTMGGKKLKLAIWDTAGQERFKSLPSSDYRGAQGIVMVYDVTRRETFTNLSEIWAREIDLYSTNQDCIKMLVGNKVDKESARAVSKKEGIDFARQYGCLFIECSAKTRVKVEQCFEELILKCLRSMKRLRSSDDLDSYGEKSLKRSSSHRSFYYSKSNEVPHKGLPSSSSRYDRDRPVDDDSRENSRIVRKRLDHDLDGIDRRKNAVFDRYAERKGYGGDLPDRDGYNGYRGLIHRTESFSSSKREFPKRYRSQRDRSRHEGSVSSSSWQRIGSMGRDFDESRGTRGGFMEERERKGLRDIRSPSLSGSEQSKKGFRESRARDVEKDKSPSMSRGDSGNEYLSKSRSPSNRLTDQKVKEERSPSCSSEQSRSIEAKKVEDAPLEGGGHSSEMEEGELEPEAKDVSDPDPGNGTGENVVAEGADGDSKNGDRFDDVKTADVEDIYKPNVDVEGNSAVKDEQEAREDQLNGRSGSRSSSNSCDTESAADAEESKEEVETMKGIAETVVTEAPIEQEQVQTQHELKEDKGICFEVKAVRGTTVPVLPEKMRVPEVPLADTNVLLREGSTLNFMDKEKSVAEPMDILESAEVGSSIKEKTRGVISSKEIYMEGPSSRGFELFSSSSVRKPEKSDQLGPKKEEKQALEALDLSLSLPNVLLPIGAQDTSAAPGSPSQARSVQSWSTFQSNSEGFSMSMSFSGSQSYFHNPSCSLTQNSMDYEHSVGKSVGSRPLFQGVDWEALAQNDVKPKELPLYQRIMANGSGPHQPSVGEASNSNEHILHGLRAAEGTSKMPKLLERQLIFNKQIPGGQSKVHEDVKSPAQSVGSHEIGPSYTFERKRSMAREKHGGSSLYRSPSQKEEQIWFGGADFVEAIVEKIVIEPVFDMTRKFHEMRGDLVAKLKEGVREIMLNPDKHGQLLDFQRSLHNRSDITIEVLLNAHRAQLEILVALKTGLVDYLQAQSSTSPSDLAEIFLNQRCRNLNCRYALPVNDCDCKVCVTKNGFCSDCMCLVCSRFDMASNTCKWVGCDICLHWCHVDCALRESLIRNGQSATSGQTEMQFHCIACDHPSEMFGFVKEVFSNFIREWSAENLSRELEYVKRVFCDSKDMRGRRLFELADQLLVRLGNKNNFADARSLIMDFFNESNPAKFSSTHLPSGSLDQPKVTATALVGPKQQDMQWMKSVYLEKNPLHLDRPSTIIPSSSMETNNKAVITATDLERSTRQKPLFDELDSIIRIKQAEASMFQSRADDARREAEGLKRIAVAKNEKIDEEYSARVAKLRLAEAEEMRKQKFEELQGLERAHREYFNMKIRMESDIKDLLLKMESTKRNLVI